MTPVVIQGYFWFGTVVRYLQDAKEKYPIHGEGFTLENLEGFFNELDELGLPVTKRASSNLEKFHEQLRTRPQDAELSAADAATLARLMSDVRKTLDAELGGKEAYVVTPKRIDVSKLREDVASLFAPGVYDALPDIAKYDIAEGSKCILFERATAAAFHLMRGTEAVLREFYCHYVKRDRCDPLLWGPMVQGLQKHRQAKKEDALLRNLDNIRISFRNPTQHPEKVYDIHEVQDLWGLSVDVINRMIKGLSTRGT